MQSSRALDPRTFGAREQGAPASAPRAIHRHHRLAHSLAMLPRWEFQMGRQTMWEIFRTIAERRSACWRGKFLAVAQRRHEPAEPPWTAPMALQSGVRSSSFDSLHALVRLAPGCVVAPARLRQIACRRRSSVVLLGRGGCSGGRDRGEV